MQLCPICIGINYFSLVHRYILTGILLEECSVLGFVDALFFIDPAFLFFPLNFPSGHFFFVHWRAVRLRSHNILLDGLGQHIRQQSALPISDSL